MNDKVNSEQSTPIGYNDLRVWEVVELKHKINLKAMQFMPALMFLNGTKPAIFYTRCYALVADLKR